MTTQDTDGRRERFTAFYGATYLDVLRFVARRAGQDTAEDLTHEAFTIAWRRWDEVPQNADGARAWTFTVARNLVLAAHRRRSRTAEIAVALDEADTGLGTVRARSGRGAPAGGPVGSLAGEDEELWTTRLAIAEAWSRLSPTHQEAIALSVWEGLDAESAGQVLGVSAAAFRVRLHRARQQLREALDAAITPPQPALTAKDAR